MSKSKESKNSKSKDKKSDGIKVLQRNKKAFFNYEIVDTIECGLALVGSEVKSMKAGMFSFQDSYVKIENGSLFLVNFNIQPYKESSIFNHKPMRPRRLLCHRQEIKRLRRKVEEKGFSLVVTDVHLKRNLIKGTLALARGKTLVNKKNAIKERDVKREMAREMRDRM